MCITHRFCSINDLNIPTISFSVQILFFMHICIYMYIHIHTYMYIHIHTYMYAYIYVYMYIIESVL